MVIIAGCWVRGFGKKARRSIGGKIGGSVPKSSRFKVIVTGAQRPMIKSPPLFMTYG